MRILKSDREDEGKNHGKLCQDISKKLFYVQKKEVFDIQYLFQEKESAGLIESKTENVWKGCKALSKSTNVKSGFQEKQRNKSEKFSCHRSACLPSNCENFKIPRENTIFQNFNCKAPQNPSISITPEQTNPKKTSFPLSISTIMHTKPKPSALTKSLSESKLSKFSIISIRAHYLLCKPILPLLELQKALQVERILKKRRVRIVLIYFRSISEKPLIDLEAVQGETLDFSREFIIKEVDSEEESPHANLEISHFYLKNSGSSVDLTDFLESPLKSSNFGPVISPFILTKSVCEQSLLKVSTIEDPIVLGEDYSSENEESLISHSNWIICE